MSIILYDLAGNDPDRRLSPYCWRTRLALAHKGLEVNTIPWRFVEKDQIAPSAQGRVPVIVDGDRWVSDSWMIATYLEAQYSKAPSLFGGSAGEATSRLHSAYADALVMSIFPFIALDVLNTLHAKDKGYFRQSREERFGATLESVVANRERRLPAFRSTLAPLRNTLKEQPFFGGNQPLYADYALFGPFQWARCTSAFELLAPDDAIQLWFTQMLDLFGGLARHVPAH